MGLTNYTPGSVVTSPVTNAPLKCFRGWPLEAQLDTDLLAGITNISVFPSPGMARNTTRYFRQYSDVLTPNATFTASVSGNTVTFGGSVTNNTQVVGVGYPPIAYTYRLSPSDTPAGVAAIFAAHIPNTTAAGPAITISTTLTITAMVLADTTALLETRRQEQLIRVSVWAPDPATRDLVFSTVDGYLSNVRMIEAPDGSFTGPIWYRGCHVDDAPSKERLWIRHGNYAVDYPTTLQQEFPRVMFQGYINQPINQLMSGNTLLP
jgi:hypothetical protein